MKILRKSINQIFSIATIQWVDVSSTGLVIGTLLRKTIM